MKVAYFLGGLNRGGAETLMLDICRQHEEVPYEFVCIYRHEGNMSEAFRDSGAPLVQVPKSKGLITYIRQIRKAFLRERITIVHSQTPSNTLLLAFALFGTGIKIITTFHGHSFADAQSWHRRIVYKASKKIICVSKYQKHYYETRWRLPNENKLVVVYNGIDFTKFDCLEPREDLTFDIGDWTLDKNSGIRLCMVGNFIKGRSQIVVCEALKELSVKCKVEGGKWDFYFIGRRDETEPWRYDECVQYCKENNLTNVHFLGGREEVPSLLKSMDGFVYSTEHDTFGIAVIEAIASKLSVVVNDWPVMGEVCDLGLPKLNTAIRFFRTVDIEDCAEKMTNLLDDIRNNKQQLKTYCIQASEAVKQKYSIQNHIEQIYKVYSQIDNK